MKEESQSRAPPSVLASSFRCGDRRWRQVPAYDCCCHKSSPSRMVRNRRFPARCHAFRKRWRKKWRAGLVAGGGRTWQNGVEPVVCDYVTHRLASRFIRPRRSRRSPSGGHRHPKSTLPMCTNDGTFLRRHQPASKTTDGDRFWKSCSSELRLATSRCATGYAGWCEKTERPLERTSKRPSSAGRSGCPLSVNLRPGSGKCGRISAPASPE